MCVLHIATNRCILIYPRDTLAAILKKKIDPQLERDRELENNRDYLRVSMYKKGDRLLGNSPSSGW